VLDFSSFLCFAKKEIHDSRPPVTVGSFWQKMMEETSQQIQQHPLKHNQGQGRPKKWLYAIFTLQFAFFMQ